MPTGHTHKFDEELREFARITSAHGVRYIFHGHSISIKVIFFLFWACAVIFCIVRASASIRKYLEEKTTTRYEMHPASSSAIMQFPTITACNYNKVKKSYLSEKSGLLELWQLISGFELGKLANIDWEEQSIFKQYENMTYNEILEEGEMGSDTLISCTQGRMRYCVDTEMGENYFVRDVEFVSGSCFRINPNGTLRGKSGDYGVLSVILLADRPEYIDNRSDVGWILAAHESERYGSSIDNGIKITPGYAYSINIDTMMVNNHKKHCAYTTGKLSGYGRFDQSTCLLDCRDTQLNATCGCLNSTPPINERGFKECTLKQVATCSLQAYFDYVMAFSDVTADQSYCDCEVVACHYTLFGTTVTAIPIPDTELTHKLNIWGDEKKFKRFVNFTVEDLRNNMAVVEVYFGSSSITVVEEVIAYDFDNLLGDIGGVMGLFLGASMFTAMEFFTLLVALVMKLITSDKGRRVAVETNL